MSWLYRQSTGELFDPDGKRVAKGYSGNGEWKNKPEAQNVKGHGPLPRGKYTMEGVYDSQKVGKFAITLKPDPKNVMFGRGDFRVHGDSVKNPGTASEGCIIMPRNTREQMWASTDKVVEVVE